jgi:hypothetical protein
MRHAANDGNEPKGDEPSSEATLVQHLERFSIIPGHIRTR